MHVVATMPSPGDRDARATMLPLLDDLATAFPDTLEHVARTWDRATGAPIVQVVLAGDEALDETVERLRAVIAPDVASIASVDVDDVPSPLWNAGVAGPGLASATRPLLRDATVLATRLARAWRHADSDEDALETILRTMVAHCRASLHDSPQARVPGWSASTLLHLRMLSFRSHYESVFARAAQPEALEAACEQGYARLGHAARDAIDQTSDGADDGGDDVAERWAASVRAHHASLAAGFADGTLTDAGRTLEDLERESGRTLERTRFHGTMTPAMRALMYEDHDFLAFRLETSTLYSALHTLGCSLAERYMLCYLVARANEDVAGRSADALRDELDALAVQLLERREHAAEPVR